MIEAEEGSDGGRLLLRLAPVSWLLAGIGAAALLAYAVPRGDDAPLEFAAIVLAVCGALWVFPFSGLRARRAAISLFLLAFAVRLAAALIFDSLATSAGDPYAGSPDAWSYDMWARRLVSSWSQGRGLTVSSYYAAGRWDVGFHYVLALFYGFFGESILGARLLVACFGAAAVVFFCLIARRLAGDSVGVVAGLLYAFWLSSVCWSGFTVLRDPLVWALMFGAVWFALRASEGSGVAALALFLCLAFLRSVRPYAEVLVVAGLALGGILTLLRRPRGVLRPALILAGAVLAVEVVFFAARFPTVFQMVPVYKPRQVLLKPLKEVPLSEIHGYPAAAPAPTAPVAAALVRTPVAPPAAVPAPALDGEQHPPGPPPRLFGPSLPANTLRFFLSPPGWAPVPGDIAHSDNWQLPGMWLWYAILPVAVLGVFVSARGSPALQSLTVAASAFVLVLILVGRGDSARQREMVVPVFLLWFALGVGPALRRPRRWAVIYCVYAVILAAGIVYHRGTLRARGMVQRESPCEGKSPAGGFWVSMRTLQLIRPASGPPPSSARDGTAVGTRSGRRSIAKAQSHRGLTESRAVRLRKRHSSGRRARRRAPAWRYAQM